MSDHSLAGKADLTASGEVRDADGNLLDANGNIIRPDEGSNEGDKS